MTVCSATSGEIYELNITGNLVWENCDNATEAQLVKRLHSYYPEANIEQVRTDVERLIVSFEAAGLVHVSASTNALTA